MLLSYERLDVYQAAMEFLVASGKLDLHRGNGALADQLRRAALSIPLNIAEAAGKTTAPDRVKFYGIARGSAMECAAILDACRALALLPPAQVEQGRLLLIRIVSMLSRLCRRPPPV
jgi:four helix bundle protein